MLLSFRRLFHYSSRILATSVKSYKSALSELRKKTGFSFINCKKALTLFDNDIREAEEWLHKEAQKEGWARVGQLQNRPMSQGLVGVIHEGQHATIIEVNCETDFVSKNDKFQKLVAQLANICHGRLSMAASPGSVTTLGVTDLGKIKIDDESTISDLVATDVGVIRENMVARRAVHMCASPGATLASYAHIAANNITSVENCIFGKYVTLLEYRPADTGYQSPLSDDVIETMSMDDATKTMSMDDSARRIGQHIAGMNPSEVGQAPVTPPDIEPETGNFDAVKVDSNMDIMFGDAKRLEEQFLKSEKLQAAIEYDNDEMVDRNQDNEDYFESTDISIEDTDDVDYACTGVMEEKETALLKQKFLLDESVTVADFLRDNKIEVLNFVRYECGEEIREERPNV